MLELDDSARTGVAHNFLERLGVTGYSLCQWSAHRLICWDRMTRRELLVFSMS